LLEKLRVNYGRVKRVYKDDEGHIHASDSPPKNEFVKLNNPMLCLLGVCGMFNPASFVVL
jgi:hypothetical protein